MSARAGAAARLTIEEFLAFTESRPSGERWELIEGVARMSPSPTDVHQMIAANICRWLGSEAIRSNASWIALLGVGTIVPASPDSLPQPDAYVTSAPLAGMSTTDGAIVLFEVLSRSNTRADQAWRRKVYSSVPNCAHYVTFSQTEIAATRFDRADGWQGASFSGSDAALPLPALGPDIAIPFAEAYRWTPLLPRS